MHGYGTLEISCSAHEYLFEKLWFFVAIVHTKQKKRKTVHSVALALYPGLPMFFNVSCEKSGRPGQLCDVIMTYGHYLGRGLKISANSPTQMSTCTVLYCTVLYCTVQCSTAS